MGGDGDRDGDGYYVVGGISDYDFGCDGYEYDYEYTDADADDEGCKDH